MEERNREASEKLDELLGRIEGMELNCDEDVYEELRNIAAILDPEAGGRDRRYEVMVAYRDGLVQLPNGKPTEKVVFWNVRAMDEEEAVAKAKENHFAAHPDEADLDIVFECCGHNF